MVVNQMKKDFNNDDLLAFLGRLANKWGTGHESVTKILEQTKKFLKSNNDRLSFLNKAEEFISMLSDYSKGDFSLNDAALGWIIATLAYLILPTDLIPDFLPGIGFTDDAAAFIIAFKQLSNELRRYREWKKIQKNSSLNSEEKIAKNN
jgi:uncharacterized membrane protein YkvA (DUF1232 family)